jgi:hypothetical protein
LFGTEVVIGLEAVLNKAAETTSLLLALGALNFITAAYTFAQILELILLVQEYLWSPQSTEFVNICLLMSHFNGSIDRPAFDSHVLILA